MARVKSLVKVTVSGSRGRMGARIIALIAQDPSVELVGAIERRGTLAIGELAHPALGVRVTDDAASAIRGARVLIEFSEPEATMEHVRAARASRTAVVIGTTGLSAAQVRTLRQISRHIPVLLSPNMSLGVSLLSELVREAARQLGASFDAEIVEVHHRLKKDAPSGTALRLAEMVAEGRGQQLDNVSVYGRRGLTGERPAGQIAVHAVRGGDVVGDHTVLFAGPFERIEITHRAHSRDVFALGAIRAAKYLAGRKPGWYSMRDVLSGIR